MWKMVLKADRPYWADPQNRPHTKVRLDNGERARLFYGEHFRNRLQSRFPDIKIQRITNAIKRKLNRGQLPNKTTTMVKLIRQESKDGKKHRKLPPAFLVLKRYNKSVHVKTITHLREEKAKRLSIIEEN